MAKKTKSIPVNTMADDLDAGIAIEKVSFPHLPPPDKVNTLEEDPQSHRHNTHTFHLLEKGTVHLEIDFQQYKMKPLSVIYIHPDQVHRTTAADQVTVVSLAITNENLNPEYLKLLKDLVPVKPLELASPTVALVAEAVSFCLNVYDLLLITSRNGSFWKPNGCSIIPINR